MALGYCVGQIIELVIGIRAWPLLGVYVGMLLWSEYGFSEGLGNGSQLGSMGVILSVDVLVSEDGLKVVTDDRNFDGEKWVSLLENWLGQDLV